MVEIKLESDEQVVDKVVNHYGNVTGLKVFEGKKVKVVVLGDEHLELTQQRGKEAIMHQQSNDAEMAVR